MLESNHIAPRPTVAGLFLLINGLALSFFFSPGSNDIDIWGNWMHAISNFGLVGGYTGSDTDYPPLAFVILAGVVKIAAALQTSPFVVLKCSLFIFLLGTAAVSYCFTRNLLLTAALELALILNSMALSYLDIYVAPFFIASLFFLQRGKLNIGFVLFAISCFMKWQPLIIAPFVCLYVVANANERVTDKTLQRKKQIVPFVLAAGIVGLPLILIFGWKVFDALHRAMTYHKFLSAYALNLPWIETWLLHLVAPNTYGPLAKEGIDLIFAREPIVVWPNKILFYLTYAAILFGFVRQAKTFERLITYSILGYLAYFNFNTSVHENHLFLVCCLGWVLVFIKRSELVRWVTFCVAANANLFLFYGVFGERVSPVIAGVDITVLFAAFNLWLFAELLWQTLRTDSTPLTVRDADGPLQVSEN